MSETELADPVISTSPEQTEEAFPAGAAPSSPSPSKGMPASATRHQSTRPEPSSGSSDTMSGWQDPVLNTGSSEEMHQGVRSLTLLEHVLDRARRDLRGRSCLVRVNATQWMLYDPMARCYAHLTGKGKEWPRQKAIEAMQQFPQLQEEMIRNGIQLPEEILQERLPPEQPRML